MARGCADSGLIEEESGLNGMVAEIREREMRWLRSRERCRCRGWRSFSDGERALVKGAFEHKEDSVLFLYPFGKMSRGQIHRHVAETMCTARHPWRKRRVMRVRNIASAMLPAW